MLKGIPSVLSPDLMKTMLEMGHGDELIIADAHFPAASHAQRLIRCDGLTIPELLKAILIFFPLDTYVENPVALMKVVEGDPVKPTIWNEYSQIFKEQNVTLKEYEMVERMRFYERARNAYAILATSEQAQYANIVLKKGVVPSHEMYSV